MKQLIGYLLVFIPILLMFGYMIKEDWKDGLIAVIFVISVVVGMGMIR